MYQFTGMEIKGKVRRPGGPLLVLPFIDSSTIIACSVARICQKVHVSSAEVMPSYRKSSADPSELREEITRSDHLRVSERNHFYDNIAL